MALLRWPSGHRRAGCQQGGELRLAENPVQQGLREERFREPGECEFGFAGRTLRCNHWRIDLFSEKCAGDGRDRVFQVGAIFLQACLPGVKCQGALRHRHRPARLIRVFSIAIHAGPGPPGEFAAQIDVLAMGSFEGVS